MVVLVGGEDEQGIALVDAIVGKPVEECAKGLVVRFELVFVRLLTRAERPAVTPAGVVAVGIGDVRVGDRDTMFLHRGDIGQRLGGRDAAKARETGRPAIGIDHRLMVEVGHVALRVEEVGTERRDHGRHVLVTEEPVEANVSAWLASQVVCDRSAEGITVGAEGGALGAVDRDANEVSGGLVLRRRGPRFDRLSRTGTEDRRHIRG
jgi:hypothetical protein